MIWVAFVLTLVATATAIHLKDARLRQKGRRVLERQIIAPGWELPYGVTPDDVDFFARRHFDLIRGRVLDRAMTGDELQQARRKITIGRTYLQ